MSYEAHNRINLWETLTSYLRSHIPTQNADLMSALAHSAKMPGQEIELITVKPFDREAPRTERGWLIRVYSCYDAEDGPFGEISLWLPQEGSPQLWDTTKLFDYAGLQLWVLEWDHHGRLCQATYKGKTGRLYGVDIDWCERDECYYWHEHGSGPGPRVHLCGKIEGCPSTLWAHDHAQFETPILPDPDNLRAPRKLPISQYVSREDLAALGYTFRMAPPTEDPCRSNPEGRVYHCEPCDDAIPEDEPCEHGDPEPG